MPREKLSLKSAGWLSIINLGLALVGILQTIVIARVFGASREIEIYFAATTFLMLMMKVSSAGQIGDLFEPSLSLPRHIATFNDISIRP